MANYIYNRSAAKWQSMYSTYREKYFQAAGIGRFGARDVLSRQAIQPLSLEEFKAKYALARNTNIARTGRAGNVYKTLIERDRTSPYQLTRNQARAIQAGYRARGEKPPTQQELMLRGGDTVSDYNRYLKMRFPEMSGRQRADAIGEIFFGS